MHEAHLGYVLQFMTDFNLYGCGWVEVGEAFLRGPPVRPNKGDTRDPAGQQGQEVVEDGMTPHEVGKRC